MEYQNYEEYMRSVLGYAPQNPNIYESYDNTYYRNEYVNHFSEEEANELYPEIYRLINHMVCKVCETNIQPITKDLIEKMTEEVYNAIEDTQSVVNVRIETPKEVRQNSNSNVGKVENRGERSTKRIEELKNTSVANRVKENVESSLSRGEDRIRRPQNSSLRDLIKILILKQLIGGNNRPPVRPPRPPYPGMPSPRPPYPGPRPPMGGPNPIIPRDYEDYLKF